MATQRRSRIFSSTLVILIAWLQTVSPNPVLNTPSVYDTSAPVAFNTPWPSCASRCSDLSDGEKDDTVLGYKVGSVYTYDYEVDTITSMRGASDQESRLKLKARAVLQPVSTCDYVLKLADVHLLEGEAGAEQDPSFGRLLEKNAIQFGVDERSKAITNVCSSTDDATWIVNIKKGLISAFQATVQPNKIGVNVTETDVVGTCETEYEYTTDGLAQTMAMTYSGRTMFKKTKHMSTCRNNQKLYQFALNIPDVNIQRLPLIGSEHTCEVAVSGTGKMEESNCYESHVFQPFSTAKSGATTTQKQQLKLIKEKASFELPLPERLDKKTNLLFEYEEDKDLKQRKTDESHVNEILAALSTTAEDLRPALFSDLVHSLRRLKHSQLVQTFYNVADSETRKFVFDAIPLLKTDAGILLMKDIIKSGQLSTDTLDAWFSTFPFYKNPTRVMIATISDFLNGRPRNSALLGVAAMVNTFCANSQGDRLDCGALPEVKDIILRYEGMLGSSCHSIGQDEEDQIVLSLKGLRSIGSLHRAEDVVYSCYNDFTNSIYVRLAALDVIRTVACSSQSLRLSFDPKLMRTFTDTTQDSELRIGAYLALMACPQPSTVSLLKSVLMTEPVNQVGSFVWTHLTNIQESQSLLPYKKALKNLVGSDFLQNKWNTDVRKFSRYFETSYYAQQLQVGATVEGSLIFSHESYVPRSAMINISTNVFGENLNLVEFGTRVEGFEKMIEDLFGPEGYFREDTFHKLLRTFRNKRDVDPQEAVSDFQQTFNNDYDDHTPRGNMYMRMFGKELYYSSFNGINDLASDASAFWPTSLFGIGNSNNNNGIDFSRSSIFLDGKIVVPTAAGLPLDLAVNGTSTVSLKSETEFDLGGLFTTGSAKALAKIYPTATIEVSGTMKVNAHYAETGLKSLTKLHTSTFLDGQIEMDGGKLVKAALNMPREKMEFVDVAVDFFTMQNGDFNALISKHEVESYSGCTPTSLGRVLGVEVCGLAKYYNNADDALDVYFAGPSAMRLFLKKTDTFQRYTFEYSWTRDEESIDLEKINVILDTPGSMVNRRSSAHLSFDRTSLAYLSLGLEIPVNNVMANLVYNWGEQKKLIKGSLSVERRVVSTVYVLLKKTEYGRHEAEAMITYFDTQVLHWTGLMSATPSKSSFSARFDSAFHDPISIKGDLLSAKDRWDVTSDLKSSALSLEMAGQFKHTDTSFDIKGDARYSLWKRQEEHLRFDGSYIGSASGSLGKHQFRVSIDPSAYPWLNTEITWENQQSGDYLENTGRVRVGSRSYVFEQLYSSQATSSLQELLFKVAFSCPDNGVEYKLDLQHRNSHKETINRLNLAAHKTIRLSAYWTHEKGLSLALLHKIRTGIQYPGLDLAAGLDLGQKSATAASSYTGQTFLRWGSNPKTSEVKAEFDLQKGEAADVDFVAATKLHLPYLETIEMAGTIMLESNGALVSFDCHQGPSRYTSEVRLSCGNGFKNLEAKLESNTLSWLATVRLRHDNVKSIHADLQLNKHYVFNAVARQNFRDLLMDFAWDQDVDPSKRLILKGKLTPSSLSAHFKVFDHVGDLTAECSDEALKVEIAYNGQSGIGLARYKLDPSDLEVGVSLTTTLPSISEASFLIKSQLITRDVPPGVVLISKIEATWNDKKHILNFQGQKDTHTMFTLSTSSTFEPADSFFLTMNHDRQGKAVNFTAAASYKSKKFELLSYFNNEKVKEGQVNLVTPWDCLREAQASYKLSLGKDLKLLGDVGLNGNNFMRVEVTGHIKKNDVKMDVVIEQTTMGKLTGSIEFSSNSNQSKMATELNYGPRGFKASAFYMPSPQTAGLNWDMKLPGMPISYELKLFKGYGAIDINSHLDVKSQRVGELGWNSWSSGSNQYRVSALTKVLEHEVKFQANNNQNTNVAYEAAYTVDQELRSKVTLKLANTLQENEDRELAVVATLIAPLESSRETGLEFNHKIVEDKADTKLKILAANKALTLDTESKWSHDEDKMTFTTGFDLKTPFDYMPSASGVGEAVVLVTHKMIRNQGKLSLSFDEDTFLKLDLMHEQDRTTTDHSHSISTTAEGPWGNAGLDGKWRLGEQKFKTEWTFKDTDGKTLSILLDTEADLDNLNANLILDTPHFPRLSLQVDANSAMSVDKTKRSVNGHVLLTFPEKLAETRVTLEHLVEGYGASVKGSLETPTLDINEWNLDSSLAFVAENPQEQGVDAKLLVGTDATSPPMLNSLATMRWKNDDKSGSIVMDVKAKDKKYHLTASVDPEGEDKHFRVKASRGEGMMSLDAVLTNNDTLAKSAISLELKCPRGQKTLALRAEYDKTTNEWEGEYKRNSDVLKMTGSFRADPNLFHANTRLENNFISAIKNFTFTSTMDKRGHLTILKVEGKTDDNSHTVHMNGNIEASSGSFSLTSVLPILGLDEYTASVQYNIAANAGDVIANINGSGFDAHWERSGPELTVVVTTPNKQYKLMRVMESTQNYRQLDVLLTMGSVKMVELKYRVEYYKSLAVAIETVVDSLRHFELAMNANSISDFKFALGYNDDVRVNLEGSLSPDFSEAKYELNFLLPRMLLQAPYQAKFEYSLVGEEKAFSIHLRGVKKSILVDGILEADHAIFTVDSWLCGGIKTFEALWDLPNGTIKIVSKSNFEIIHRSLLTFNIDSDNYKGTANLTSNMPMMNMFVDYDIGGTNKRIVLTTDVEGNIVTMSSIYQMTEDTFKGELVWKSNIAEYESAIINAQYNIATEPTASISIEQNGVKNFVRTKLSFDNVIPTVYISTSFPGFERLIFKGSYETDGELRRQVDLMVSRNGETLLALANKMTATPDLTSCEIISTLSTPIPGWRNLHLEVGWKQDDDPYAIKLKIRKEATEYFVKGKLVFRSKEFKITAATPIVGYESISLSGRFGTTSIGKQFGISFEQNAVRRDVSFAYGIDDGNVGVAQIRTPLEQYKSIKVRSLMLADMGKQMDFGFEVQGAKNDLALGLKYDFSRGLANGMILAKAKASQGTKAAHFFSDLEGKIEYNDVDGILANGFGGSFNFIKDGTTLAAGKVNREVTGQSGRTTVSLKTPFSGYEKLDLELKSDYETNLLMVYERNGVATSLSVDKKGPQEYELTIKTPIAGYEKVLVTYKREGTVAVITISRPGHKMSTITIDSTFDLVAKRGHLMINWEMTQSLRAEVSITYADGQGTFKLKTPSKNWHVVFYHSDDGTTSEMKLNADIDGKKITYSTTRTWVPGLITGQSILITNVPKDFLFLEPNANRKTDYKISYSDDFNTPLEITYKTVNKGATELDFYAKLGITMGEGFDFKGKLSMPNVLLEDVVFALAAKTDRKTSLVITAQYNQINVQLDAKLLANEASITLTTNIPGFDHVQGKTTWMSKGQRTKIDYFFDMNKQRLVEGSLAFDQNPFTRFKFVIKSGETFQEIEIRKKSAGDECTLDITTRGLSNVVFNGKVKRAPTFTTMRASIKGDTYSMGPVDYSAQLAVRYNSGEYGLNAEVAKGTTTAKLRTQLKVAGPMAASGDASLNIPVFGTFDAKMGYNFDAPKKTFDAAITQNGQTYKATGEVQWAPQEANIKIQASAGPGKELTFVGARKGFESMSYVMNVMGNRIAFVSSNTVTTPADFNISAKLEFPLGLNGPTETMELTLISQRTGPDSVAAKGTFTADGSETKFAYDHKEGGKEFNLSITSSGRQLLLKYGKSADGMKLTITEPETGTTEMFENISRGGSPCLIYVAFQDTNKVKHGKVSLQIDLNEKTFEAKAQYKNDWAKLTGKAKVDGNKYDLRLEGATSDEPGTMSLSAIVTYPTSWKISYAAMDGYKWDLGLDIKTGDNYNGGIDFTFKKPKISLGSDWTDDEIDLKVSILVVNNDSERSGKISMSNMGKTADLVVASKEGSMNLEINSPIERLQHIKLEAEYNSNRIKIEFEYGDDEEIEIEFGRDNKKLFFQAEAEGRFEVKGKVDMAAKTLSFFVQIGGRVVSIEAMYEAGKLVITATEPFTSAGKLQFDGRWEKLSNGLSLKATGDVNAINYSLDVNVVAEDARQEVSATMRKGLEDWNLKASSSVTPKGREAMLSMSGSSLQDILVKGSYQLTDVMFTGVVSAGGASLGQETRCEVIVEFDYPNAVGIKATAVTDGNAIFDVEASLRGAQNDDMKFIVKAVVPDLGLKEHDFGVEVVYRAIHISDFHIMAAFSGKGKTYKGGVKFYIEEHKLDAEILFNLGEQDVTIKIGGDVTHDSEGGHLLNGYINTSKLTFYHDRNYDKIHITFKRTNDDESFSTQFLSIAGNDCGNIDADLKYDRSGRLEFQAKMGKKYTLGCKYVTTGQVISGGVEVKSPNYNKKAEFNIHYGDKGRIEITVGGVGQHKLMMERLQIDEASGLRRTRAVFDSPTFGKYDFEMDNGFASGILVLSTDRGIHKLSYEFTESTKRELILQLDSPYLDNGHATLQLSMDTYSNNYSGRLTFNDDVYVAAAFGWTDAKVDGSFSVETIYLSHPINGYLKLVNDQTTCSSLFSLTFSGQTHSVEMTIIKEDNMKGIFQIKSPILPKILLESLVSQVSNSYGFDATAIFGEDALQFNGNITYNNRHDFQGKLSYQGSAFYFSHAKLNYMVYLYDKKSTIDFDLTTSHPDLPRARIMFDLEAVDDQRYSGVFNLVTPLDSLVHIYGQMSLPTFDQNNIVSNNAWVKVATPSGEYKTDLVWDFYTAHKAQLTVEAPGSLKVVGKIWAKPNNFLLEFDSNADDNDSGQWIPSSLSVRVTTSPSYDLYSGDLELTYTDSQKRTMSINLGHDFRRNGKHLSGKTLINEDRYEFNLGYEDTARKSLKAHMECPRGATGFQFDYYFDSITSFLVLAEVDLPIPGLKVTSFKLSNHATDNSHDFAFGGEWSQSKVDVESRLKMGAQSFLLDSHVIVNEHSIAAYSSFDLDDMKLETQLDGQLPIIGKVNIKQMWRNRHYSDDFELSLSLDGIVRFEVKNDVDTNTASIGIRDVYYPTALVSSITLQQDSPVDDLVVSVSNTITWDTQNPETTTEALEVSFRKTINGGDFQATVNWPNHDTDQIKGNLNRQPGYLMASLSVDHNSDRIFGLDTNALSEFTGHGIDHSEKVSLTLPTHAVEYDFDVRFDQNSVSYGANLLWAKSGEPLSGLGYVMRSESTDQGNNDFSLILRRLESSGEGPALEITTRSSKETNALKIEVTHPTDTSRQMTIEVGTLAAGDHERPRFGLKTKHQIGNSDVNVMDLLLELDTTNKQLKVTLATEKNSYVLQGRVEENQSQQNIRGHLTKDSQILIELDSELDTAIPHLRASIECASSGNTISFFGGLKQDNLILFQLERSENQFTEVDVMTKIELSPNGKVLKVEVQWKPDFFTTAKDTIVKYKNDLANSDMSVNLWENIRVVGTMGQLATDEIFADVLSLLELKVDDVAFIARRFQENLQSLKLNSYFAFVGDCVEHVTGCMVSLSEKSAIVLREVLKSCKTVIEMTRGLASYTIDFSLRQLEAVARFSYMAQSKAVRIVASWDIDATGRIGSGVRSFLFAFRDFLEWFSDNYRMYKEYFLAIPISLGNELDADLREFLTVASRSLKQFKVVNEVLTFYLEYQSWFEEFHFSRHLQETFTEITEFCENASRQLAILRQTFDFYWNQTVGLVDETMSDYPLLAYGSSVVKRFFRVAKALAEQYSVENNIRAFVRKVIGRVDSLASVMVRVIDVVYHKKDLVTYDLSYRPADGIFVYEQTMPFHWYSFGDSPDVVKVAQFVGLTQEEQATLQEFDIKEFQHDLFEVISTVSEAVRTRSIIPPFSATAMLAGDSHLMTFDRKFYNFAGSKGCSYLLASDFSQSRFSIVAHHEAEQKRTSIDILSDGHVIKIETLVDHKVDDGLIKVTLNKRNVQLPFEFDHTYVRREENTIIVENSEGLKAVCNTVFNVCTFTISGWFFGKTGGLLGVYDNEPSNDFMTADRKVVDDLADFVTSWQIDKTMRCPVKFISSESAANQRQNTRHEIELCDEIFRNTDSALMPCFTSVDPEPFHQICLSDMDSVVNQADKRSGVCPSSAAYIELCRRSGIELWMPAQCVSCKESKTVDGLMPPLKNGESSQFQGNAPRSSDVVFIVEQTSCVAKSHLIDVPYLVDRALESNMISENRFAIVGYGGPGKLSQPHIFTSGNQIFSDKAKMTASLQNLKTDGNGGSLLETLRFAGRLSFRPGVAKTFVLVTCDPKSALSPVNYGDSMTMLTEQDITLHLLAPLSLTFKSTSRSKLASKLYGFSKDSVITASGSDVPLRRQLKDPKDYVSTLAQETGGTVFTLDKLASRKRTTAKKASTVIARELALRSHPSECQICDCIATADGEGQQQCHKCIMPAVDVVLKNWEKYGPGWLD